MNQAVAFGLLFGGGIILTSSITGESLADIVKGHAGSVGGKPTAGTIDFGNGVAGLGQAIGSGLNLGVGQGLQALGGYIDPFARASSITPERIDMGQDFSLAPGSPILAPGDSKVLGILPNWYAGQPYVALQLLNGPKAGSNYYVAEQINPAVKTGQIIRGGNPIGYYASHGTGIEMGWAGSDWTKTLAQEQGNTGDAQHNNAPAGLSFHQFLIDIGATK